MKLVAWMRWTFWLFVWMKTPNKYEFSTIAYEKYRQAVRSYEK